MSLNAAQERLQKNAVIIAARQAIYATAILKYGKKITVGDAAKIVTKGTTPKTYGFDFVQEGIPFLRAEEVLDGQVLYKGTPFHIDAETNNFMNRSRTESGDVLVTIAGSIGRAAVVPPSAPELNMNQAVALIRCKDEVNPYFLCHMLQSSEVQKQIFSSTVTTAISNLSLGKIKEIIIPLPPVADQEAISEFLEAVQNHHAYEGFSKTLPDYMHQIPQAVARIEELATRIEEARGLRKEAVEETEKLLPSSITRVLKTIRGETKEVTVEEVAYSVTDGDHQPPPKADSGIPFIFISNVVGGKIDFSNCKWVSPEYFASIQPNRIPQRGDVLYTAVGATYGVPCLVDTDESFCFQRHIAIIKPDGSQILPKYLKWVLSSSDAYKQATKAVTGSAQPTVPLKGIRNLRFTLPSLQEQYRIVAYLDDLQVKVNCLKQLQSETSAELDALLPSILDKAFKGEL